MKSFKRVAVLLLTLMLIAVGFPLSAQAASGASGKSEEFGGNSTSFYVSSKRAAAINLTMGKGKFGSEITPTGLVSSYGLFEIKVYTKDASGKYTKLYSKTNIVNKSSATIKLPSNTACKVCVYAWRISTIAKNFNLLSIRGPRGWQYAVDRWTTLPTWKASCKNCA